MSDQRLAGVPVVIVNNFPGPGMGGAEVQLLPIVEAFVREGAGVTVVAEPGSGFAEQAVRRGARAVAVRMSPARAAVAVRTIRAAARGAAPERRAVILGTGYYTNLLVRVAGTGTGAAVANLVAVVPGASLLDGGSRAGAAARRLADRASRRSVDRHIAVSEAVRHGLIARGAHADRIEVVLNGVDADALRRDAERPVPELPDVSGPLVVCVARLEPVKGVEHLVRAAALLGADVTVAIAGTGSQESRLREIAAAQLGGARVLFLGHIGSAAALMARADVVAVPSLSEAFGLVAAEALALGRPVVASDVGGLPEVVGRSPRGTLVPAADPGALAEGIRQALATHADGAGRPAHGSGAGGTDGSADVTDTPDAATEPVFDVATMCSSYVRIALELSRSADS